MKQRKCLSVFLALLLLAGCGRTNSAQEQQPEGTSFGNEVRPEHLAAEAQPDEASGYIWKLDSYACSQYIDDARTLCTDGSGGFYVLGAEDAGQIVFTVYHCDEDGEILSRTVLPVAGDAQTAVGNMGVLCGADAIWFDYTVTLSTGGGDKHGAYAGYIAACDYDGNLLFTTSTQELLPSGDDNTTFGSMALYEGACAVCTDHQVMSIDAAGAVLWRSSTDRSLYQMRTGADGMLYVITYADGEDLLRLDRDTHEISASLLPLDDGMYSLCSGILGYDLLLLDTQGAASKLYGVDAASGEKTPLFDLGALGILSVGTILELPNGRLIFDYFSLMGTRSLGQLVQEPLTDDTVTLTLGVCGSLSDTALSAVEMFNSQHAYAHLSVLQYDSTDALNLAIISGEGPDIICFDGLSEEDYARNGYLCDLYALLGEETKAQLVGAYCREYETAGKLCRISPVFCCDTMLGNGAHISADCDSFADMLSAAQAAPDGCMIFELSPHDSLLMLIRHALSGFVSYASGTCDFDNAEFEALLSLSAYGTQSTPESMARFDDWLFSLRPEKLMDYDGSGDHADPALGFPDAAVLTTQPGDTFGVYSSSTHRELAGQFIALLLSEDIQRAYSDLTGYYPILRDVYEDTVPAALQSEVENASGHYIAISPVFDIISEEADAFFAGDQSAAQAAHNIQSRVGIYLGEQG